MEHVHVEPFKIIGLSVRTSDKFGKAVVDVGITWLHFEFMKLYYDIPNKTSANMHVVYTDHEPKYMGEFTAIIGCAVSSIDEVPKGMVGVEVQGGDFTKYSVHGRATEVVPAKWKEIWKKDEETFKMHGTDFEIYNNGYPLNLGKVDVDIYIADNK